MAEGKKYLSRKAGYQGGFGITLCLLLGYLPWRSGPIEWG
jgi:hypothetical protein